MNLYYGEYWEVLMKEKLHELMEGHGDSILDEWRWGRLGKDRIWEKR